MTDLDKLLARARERIEADQGNIYLEKPEKAVELISTLIRNTDDGVNARRQVRQIRSHVEKLFRLFDNLRIPGESIFYHRFCVICDKLLEQNKIKKLQDKTIISFGGRFSSGKSSFINAILPDMENLLPVEQKPTTSIPTYIVPDIIEKFEANSYHGGSAELSEEAIEAMSHNFADKHKIRLAAFVESIVISTPNFISPSIALLDTPGYNKAETNSDSHAVSSDRFRAYEQLKKTDYLIWLADVTNGTLTLDDFEFIDHLQICNPILIVFNKADKVTSERLEEVIQNAEQDIQKKQMLTPCFGITGYSSAEKKEYGRSIIPEFFTQVAKSGLHSNDLFHEIQALENQITLELKKLKEEEKQSADQLASEIKKCEDGNQLMAGSLVILWSKSLRRYELIQQRLLDYQSGIVELNHEISDFLKGEEHE